jgi:hypothetical protein
MNKMAKKGRFLLLAVFTILISFMMGFGGASPIPITTCQGLSAISNGSYIVTNFINNSGLGLDCFYLEEDNIEFDCDGNTIWDDSNGSYNAFDVGGLVADTLSNITIKNCVIKRFSTSILIAFLDDSSILNNTFEVVLNAINLKNGNNILIDSNNITQINYMGFDTFPIIIENYSISNIISNNIIDARAGIKNAILVGDATNCQNNKFINNSINTTIPSGTGAGIFVLSDNNYFINNILACNGGEIHGCLELVGSEDNIISGNTIYSAEGKGVGTVYNGNNYTITDNLFSSIYFLRGLGTSYTNYTLLNNSGATIIEGGSGGILEFITVGWYLKITVRDLNGTLIDNVTIMIYNTTNNLEYSGNTNSFGIAKFNVTEYDTSPIVYHTAYTINVSKDGYSNTTQVNFTDSINMEFTLGYNYTPPIPPIPPTNNSVPVIISLTTSQVTNCISPNTTIIITIEATDKENETIYYAHRCSDTDTQSIFDTNNTKICFYGNFGEYNLGIYVNDSNMTPNYVAYYNYIRVTTEKCIKPCSTCTPIPVNPVDIDNINQGLLPTVYFGLISFITTPLPSVFIIFTVIVVVLIIGAIGTIISKIAQFGEG